MSQPELWPCPLGESVLGGADPVMVRLNKQDFDQCLHVTLIILCVPVLSHTAVHTHTHKKKKNVARIRVVHYSRLLLCFIVVIIDMVHSLCLSSQGAVFPRDEPVSLAHVHLVVVLRHRGHGHRRVHLQVH